MGGTKKNPLKEKTREGSDYLKIAAAMLSFIYQAQFIFIAIRGLEMRLWTSSTQGDQRVGPVTIL